MAEVDTTNQDNTKHNINNERDKMLVPIPRLYLGTMNFGWSQASSVCDEPVALEMVKTFIKFGASMASDTIHPSSTTTTTAPTHYIDTARIYASGKTESILGSVFQTVSDEESNSGGILAIGTKAHPSRRNGLSPEGIQSQFQASMETMGFHGDDTKSHTSLSPSIFLGEYYLHQPDPEHSLLDSLRTAHDLITSGHVKTLGMSNYHASEMERTFALCDEHGLTKPTVYQGLYNPLNRAVEQDLLPILRKNQCSFIAYNPLAAGLLAGKHTRPKSSEDITDKKRTTVLPGRFRNNPNYLPRFYTEANFDALDILREACQKENISLIDATYRWLLRHSALKVDNGDGLLVGASSIDQLNQNLNACRLAANMDEDGMLSDSMMEAFEEVWSITEKAGVYPYWRSYSSDMPGREDMDQGASYKANK